MSSGPDNVVIFLDPVYMLCGFFVFFLFLFCVFCLTLHNFSSLLLSFYQAFLKRVPGKLNMSILYIFQNTVFVSYIQIQEMKGKWADGEHRGSRGR